jgi:four helix bundle protein
MAQIQSFRDLEVYRKALGQAREIFVLSGKFPREAKYALIDQIRRASRAVGALIAEAWGRRRYQAAFVSKLVEALGEAMETQSWLDQALSCGYIADDEHKKYDQEWQHIGGMLNKMIERASTFCRSAAAKG